MKKLMTLAAMLAIVLGAAIPAVAQIAPEIDVEQASPESGDISVSGSVTSTGSNSNQCAAPQQFGNTGTPQDRLDVLQYASELGDLEAEAGSLSFVQFASKADDLEVGGGSPMTFEPSQEVSCEQPAQQAAAARR